MDEIVCSKCGQVAQFKCERCLEPYCSAQCQESDWQDHKAQCYKFPNLLPINIVKSVSSNLQLDRGVQRRCGSTYSLNESRRSNAAINNTKPKPKILLNDDDFNMVPKVSSSAVVKSTADKTATWRVAFPPSDGFFEAVIQFKEEDECDKRIVWVTDIKYESSLRKLLAEINRTVNKQFPCGKEFIYHGALVAVPLENMLYRAEILDISPDTQKATVRLIDYGNELRVSYSQLFAPIPIMCNLNSYAFKVCLPNDYGPVEIESIITIKILGEKQPENYYNVECKMKSISLQLPIELFTKEPTLKLVKCFVDGRNALLSLCSENGINDQELESLLNSPKSLSFEFESPPTVGAFVAARTKNGWKRARVLGFYENQHQFLIYAIDDGFMSITPEVKKLPDNFISQPIRVFAISTSSTDCMLSEAMLTTAKRLTLQLQPTSSVVMKDSKSHLPCALLDENRKIVDVVTASVFTGLVSELGVKLWHESILEGETVIISHVLTYKEIYIAAQQNVEYPKILMSEFSKCLPYAADEDINKNDIVIYIYKKRGESKCCRGQVIKCESNQFKVVDVDSGSDQMVSRVDLRKPSLSASSLPVRCLRVPLMFLESIPTPIANNKAFEALETCMDNVVEFDVTYNENKAADLLFRTKEKQSLCKKLLPMVFEPATNKGPDSSISHLTEKVSLPLSPPNTPAATSQAHIFALSEVGGGERQTDKLFTIDDLDVIPLTCGEKVPLYVLDPSTIMNAESPYITAADYNNKDFLAKMEQYLKSVSDYCKTAKDLKNGYAPKKMEICLSIFAEDGEWYRALCVDHRPNDTFLVMFLDYGNMAKVNRKDIMPMTKDLMFPSNANMVYIEGITNKEQGLAFLKSVQKNPIVHANVRMIEGADAYAAKICT